MTLESRRGGAAAAGLDASGGGGAPSSPPPPPPAADLLGGPLPTPTPEEAVPAVADVPAAAPPTAAAPPAAAPPPMADIPAPAASLDLLGDLSAPEETGSAAPAVAAASVPGPVTDWLPAEGVAAAADMVAPGTEDGGAQM